jgi:hypothetical protein
LRDLFIYLNYQTKITRNKEAFTKKYKDDNVIKYFGLKSANTIAKGCRKKFINSLQLKEFGYLSQEEKTRDWQMFPYNQVVQSIKVLNCFELQKF